MGGGLMQLVAYGAQDIYLTGNPAITFFKVIYRRHTNFSLESIEQTFNGSADFGKKVTCTISRNGDLIHNVYLRAVLPDVTIEKPTTVGTARGFRWLNWVGHILVKSVEIEIGGQRIDKQYGEWLHIWNELSQTASHAAGYANMVGNSPELTDLKQVEDTSADNLVVPGQILYIPMQFWFCRNPGLALPLIALQYHEVKMVLEFRDAKDCFWAGYRSTADDTVDWTTSQALAQNMTLGSTSLFVDYVYLDTDERRRFAQSTHEYLIEQLQFTGDESTSQSQNKIKLNFNHPCKELIWVVQKDSIANGESADGYNPLGKQMFNFTDYADMSNSMNAAAIERLTAGAQGGYSSLVQSISNAGENPVRAAKLQLNGHDRFSERDGRYFNLVQPYQHHECVPAKGVNVYSFGIQPENHQPSGTCNFSRIDNAILGLTLTPQAVKEGAANKIKVFAINYNVLRIMSGMGGLNEIMSGMCFILNTISTCILMLSLKTVGHRYSSNLWENPLCA